MNKVYTRINWENYPSEKTAVNESNLNKMDSALNEIDTRVVEHDTTKANVESLNNLIDGWVIDETTGIITIHKVSGEQIIFDLNIEKVPVGFSMTDDGILIMTTDDGTEFTANIGSMIPILTFNDSEQIAVAVSGEGVNKTYTFTIKTGSIGEDKLQPNFLADCRLYAGNAENSATLAGEYAQQAKESAESISNTAGDIAFDDSIAKLGADNVQLAIEALSALGDYAYNGLHDASIPNNTATIVDTLTLTPGTYLILADVRWEATNTTGRRSIGIGAYNTDPKPMMGSSTIQGPSTEFTNQATIMLMKIDVETGVNLVVYQNSGSTLKTGYNALRAIKIKN